MKTQWLVLLQIATILFVLAGCSENPNSSVTPGKETVARPTTTPSLGKLGPIVHSVQGGFWYDDYGNGKHIQNTIAAHEYANGTFDGMYTINGQNAMGHDKTYKWNGRVIFLKVYAHVLGYEKFAVVGGIETTGPFAGWYDVWYLIEDGPGRNDFTADAFFASEDLDAAIFEWSKTPAELIASSPLSPPIDGGSLTIK